jgi:uncharacterized protein (TIGR01777 family)
MSKILITGGNGLIGSRLQELLLLKGHEINIIGRGGASVADARIKQFTWDVQAQKMDIKALDGVDTIIHLAGAGVADSRWTASRKKEIMDSRIDSTRLLFGTLKRTTHQVKTIISASAVGYYGDCGAEMLTEDHAPGNSFLAEVTKAWEAEVSKMESLGIRHVCCRIGIVLSSHGGALPELEKTIPAGIAGYFAVDNLYYSWIHIDDVCGIMMHAVQNDNLRGSYNTTGPDPVLIKDLMKAIVLAKKSKALLVPVPPFAIKLALGQMSEAVLQSQRCGDKKILSTGYKFTFPTLKTALDDIYSK